MLVYASHNAALFARGEGLALEAVNAVVEALLDEVRVHLGNVSAVSLQLTETSSRSPVDGVSYVHELFHLFLFHARLQLALF
jgi:hypothetical protein